jgi:UDPglucose 6-dehydrogenase
MGNQVTCIDIDREKIEGLKKGIIPIYEPGLKEMVLHNHETGNLIFTTSLQKGIQDADVVFIAVGTPMHEDGSADLQQVLTVAREIGKFMIRPVVVVDKSTVPVGTADEVRSVIAEELKKRKLNIDFDVVSNPEFLKEGKAIKDFMNPDRVIIGSEREDSIKLMKALYAPFFRTHDRFIVMDTRSAEMTKYAANAMLAVKISFMNEIANICERVGADVNKVRIGIGSDTRIGYKYIYPGVGFGGSCLPKDVSALEYTALQHGYTPRMLQAIIRVNENQKVRLSEKVITEFGEDLSGKTFAVWGLAFKPETDDMRESPAIYIIKELVARGAKIRAYDPKAIEQAKQYYLKGIRGVSYCQDKYEALQGSDAMLLITEWKEFRSPDFNRIKQLLHQPVIFDGRNQYNAFDLDKAGFKYIQIGVSSPNN